MGSVLDLCLVTFRPFFFLPAPYLPLPEWSDALPSHELFSESLCDSTIGSRLRLALPPSSPLSKANSSSSASVNSDSMWFPSIASSAAASTALMVAWNLLSSSSSAASNEVILLDFSSGEAAITFLISRKSPTSSVTVSL